MRGCWSWAISRIRPIPVQDERERRREGEKERGRDTEREAARQSEEGMD
jgi:hypothetical protein